jgi:purine-cytosine permease-like protein
MAIDEVLPLEDRAFHIEQHGIDFIPVSERWATPRAVAGLWAGASVNIEYVVYGAILMTFGFSFAEAVVIIVVANLSWLLVGIASLQGPQAGTTVFGINRAPFGPRGSKAIALCNWLTMLGFETEGLILIVGAGLVLAAKAGIAESSPLKVVMILVAVGIQALLPFFGHATMAKVLRWLIVPFVVIYAVLAGFAVGHARAAAPAAPWVNWQLWMAGLAFTIALSGLGWTENGNDYSRYLPPATPARRIVGWLFVGTALPEIALMVLGAAVFSFVGTEQSWNGANPFAAFSGQHVLPSWFVVVFMCFIVVQLFSINSLDLYSSGVTLQALGAKVRRYQAVLIDSAICCGITFYAVFNSQFSTLLKDFVALVIVWIAPWCGIFLTDWLLRGRRYDPIGLQDTSATSPYWATSGIHWPALVAQVLGGIAAIIGLEASFLPEWMRPLAVHSGGADFSIFLGLGVGAGAYALLAGRSLRRHPLGTLDLSLA